MAVPWRHPASAPSNNGPAIPGSLHPGGPPFQAWKLSELPDEWKKSLQDPNTLFIAVELPDMPWGHAYHAWFASNYTVSDFGEYAATCVVNMQDYHEGIQRNEHAAEVLRSLVQTGKPPPHFLRILKPEGKVNSDQKEMVVLPTTSQTTGSNSRINSYLRSAPR